MNHPLTSVMLHELSMVLEKYECEIVCTDQGALLIRELDTHIGMALFADTINHYTVEDAHYGEHEPRGTILKHGDPYSV